MATKNKLNVQSLVPGDIILTGRNDKNSREIQQRTNSKFSHAMLYWYGSFLHASDIVITANPSRMLFEEDESVCVLRLKNDVWNRLAIKELIDYARSFVGTYYDIEALIALRKGQVVNPKENRQMCAKYVAQCYEHICFDLVDNYELCTPEDIRNSSLLREVPNTLIEATQWDEDFANSFDVTKVQHKAIKKSLELLNTKYPKEDIVCLNQLEAFIKDNPSCGDSVLEILKQTDYFGLWKIEKEHCPYNYNVEEFKKMWKGNAARMACEVENDSERIIEEKEEEINVYKHWAETVGDLNYYREMIALRDNIIATAKERIVVAKQVKEELGVVKIKYPWCL